MYKRSLSFIFFGLLLTGATVMWRLSTPAAADHPFVIPPPPPGAHVSSRKLAPFVTATSPLLHVKMTSYVVPLSARSIYAYYSPKLRQLGFQEVAGGYTASLTEGIEGWGWQFSKGSSDHMTIVLTVKPSGSTSLYSLASEVILAPPRPKTTLVEYAVKKVLVRSRSSGEVFWTARTLRSPRSWRGLLTVVNTLPMDVRGVLGCLGNDGASATVRFSTTKGSYSFSEDPACASVIAPSGVRLWDKNLRLWRVITSITGVRTNAVVRAH